MSYLTVNVQQPPPKLKVWGNSIADVTLEVYKNGQLVTTFTVPLQSGGTYSHEFNLTDGPYSVVATSGPKHVTVMASASGAIQEFTSLEAAQEAAMSLTAVVTPD